MKLEQNIPWTKLTKDSIWGHVSVKYMEPPGRLYHNMDHVVTLYKYAQLLNIPYNIDLDVAILFHDVVYDKNDNKEIRSAVEFTDIVKRITGITSKLAEKVIFPFGIVYPDNVVDSIFATINHAPVGEDTEIKNIIVMLDLYGFVKEQDRNKNFVNLANEIDVLYGSPDRLMVYENIRQNLLRIYGNLVYYVEYNENNKIPMKYEKEWNDICAGIIKQINVLVANMKLERDSRKKDS